MLTEFMKCIQFTSTANTSINEVIFLTLLLTDTDQLNAPLQNNNVLFVWCNITVVAGTVVNVNRKFSVDQMVSLWRMVWPLWSTTAAEGHTFIGCRL